MTDEGENSFTPDPAGRCYRILKRVPDETLGAYYCKLLSGIGGTDRGKTDF